MTALTWRQAVIPAPRPQGAVGMPFAAPLRLPEAVHEVELVQETWRHRHRPEDALAALLEGPEHDRAAGEVDAFGGERQASETRQPVMCSITAKGPHRPGRMGRGGEEGGPLVGGQVEALAPGVMQLHRRDRTHHIGNRGKPGPPCPARQTLDFRPGRRRGVLPNSAARTGCEGERQRWHELLPARRVSR